MAQKHKPQILLAPLLFPLSLIFGAIAKLRAALFGLGIKKSLRPHVPCLCVGNISWGGTGKSPVIDYLLKFFRARSVPCAVLSRGYGTKLPQYPFLLDKNSLLSTVPLPDEPRMLVKKNPDVAVIIGPDRTLSAAYAQKYLPETRLLLMDDGFQHFRLARDLNLVLLDKDDLIAKKNSPFATYSWNRLIPYGTWREPKSALHRASCFLVKCPPQEWNSIAQSAAEKLRPFGKPLFVFDLRIQELVPLFGKAAKPLTAYALLAGIGNPLQFKESAERFLGRPSSADFFLKDHAPMDSVLPKLLRLEIPLVCTEKDAAKLETFPQLANKEIYFTATQLNFHAALFTAQSFDSWLADTVVPRL